MADILSRIIESDSVGKTDLATPEYEKANTLAIAPELSRKPSLVPAKQKELGVVEGTATQFKQFSFWGNLGVTAYRQAENALLEEGQAPPDWKPNNPTLAEFPREYWGALLEAEGPKQQALIAERLRDDLARRAQYDRAGWGSSLIGGGAAFLADTLVPLGAIARLGKYGLMGAKSIEKLMDVKTILSLDVGAGVARNALGAIPSSAGIAAVYNAPRLGADMTYNLNEYLVDGLLETGFGAVLGGVAGGVQAKLLKNDAKGYAHYGNGVDFVPVIGKDGGVQGMKAVAAEGHSVGAAEVDAAQVWADTRMQAYKGSNFLNKAFGLSPVVRGLTSEFPVIRKFTETFFDRGGILVENDKLQNVAPQQTFEQLNKQYQSGAIQLQFAQSSLYDEYTGITGYHKDAQALAKGLIDGPAPYSKKEFYEAVSEAIYNEGKFTPEPGKPHVPQIEAAAKLQMKLQDDYFQKGIELGLWHKDSQVVGAKSYGNIVYDKSYLDTHQSEFVEDISQSIWANSQEIERLNSVFSPEEIQAKIDAGEIDNLLVDYPTPITPKDIAHIRKLNAEIAAAEAAVEQAVDKTAKKAAVEAQEALYRRIETDIELGNIPESVATAKTRAPQKGPGFWLTEEKQLPKLYKPITNQTQAREIAESAYINIMNNSEEAIASQMLGARSGGKGNSAFMARTLMVPHAIKRPYLQKDARLLSSVYANSVGRKLALEQSYRSLGFASAEEGVREVASLLKKQIDAARAPLLKDASPEGKKKLGEFNKQAKKATEFLALSNQLAMGTLYKGGSQGLRNFLKTIQQLTVMKALGGLPILQVAEAGSLLKQYQFFELFDKGLFPMIRSAFSGGKFLEQQESLSHMGLAINTYLSAAGRAWENGSPIDVHRGWSTGITDSFARGVDIVSQKFMNLTASNPIQDMLQHLSGTKAMSENIEAMYMKLQGKEYSKRQFERLRLNGLDPEKFAQRIVDQYERHGDTQSYKNGKSFEPNFHLWDDFDAKIAFLSATRKEVQTIVLTPNYLDVPFAFRDPVVQSMTMFMSYGFAAANSRLLPMLQSGDIAKGQAEVANAALAVWVQPLREYLNGEEPDLSAKALMSGMMTNSGLLGFPLDIFNRLNAFTDKDVPVLGALRNNRYDQRGIGALLGGAPGGYLEGLIRLGNDAASGKVSQGTLRNAVRMGVPGSSAWYARKPVDWLIESTGLPKTRKDADAWFPEANAWLDGLQEW